MLKKQPTTFLNIEKKGYLKCFSGPCRSNEKYRAEDRFVKDVGDQKTRVADGSRGTITWGPLSLGSRGGDDIISLVWSA